MVVPPHTTKKDLRAELKKRRQAFVSKLESSELSEHIAAMTQVALDLVKDGQSVALYRAIGDEIDPSALAHQLHKQGIALCLPHVSRRHSPMRFLSWPIVQPLIPGPFGLLQPCEGGPTVTPDIIFTPLLGFDRALNRIGYGAGYYDRAFAQYPDARRIGLAWDIQACDVIPTDPWDVPLHGIVTEKGWITR